jgi:hypothetical protein
LYNDQWKDVLIFALARCSPCKKHHEKHHEKYNSQFDLFEYRPDSPIGSIPKSVTILYELGVNALKDLDCLPIDSNLRDEIAAGIEKIPKFSTFTRCNVV